MSTDKTSTTALEVAAAAEASVVGEIVAAELADALDTLWMALDDRLVYRGVSEESVAVALRPYGLSEAWLYEWCGSVAARRSDSPSPAKVAEELLVWIDEVLDEGRGHGHA